MFGIFKKYFVLTKLFRMFLFKILTTFQKMFAISENVSVSKIVCTFPKMSMNFWTYSFYIFFMYSTFFRIQKIFNFQICLEFLKLFSISNFGLKMFLFPFVFGFFFLFHLVWKKFMFQKLFVTLKNCSHFQKTFIFSKNGHIFQNCS